MTYVIWNKRSNDEFAWYESSSNLLAINDEPETEIPCNSIEEALNLLHQQEKNSTAKHLELNDWLTDYVKIDFESI